MVCTKFSWNSQSSSGDEDLFLSFSLKTQKHACLFFYSNFPTLVLPIWIAAQDNADLQCNQCYLKYKTNSNVEKMKKEESNQNTLYFNIVGKSYIYIMESIVLSFILVIILTYKYIRLDKVYKCNRYQTYTNV